MARRMPVVTVAAVVSLICIGIFLIVLFSPLLFNEVFGEDELWSGEGVTYGVAYLCVAAAIPTLRHTLSLGAGLILGLSGFTTSAAWLLSRVDALVGMMHNPGNFSRVDSLELATMSALLVLHAVIVAGVVAAARRWRLIAAQDARRTAAAALLAGIGFAHGLAQWGGEFGILVSPIDIPVYDAVRYWLPLPHFVAAAALTLGGRFATAVAMLVCVGGIYLSIAALIAIALFGASQGGPSWVAPHLIPWLLFIAGYVGAVLRLRRSEWGPRPASSPL